jgi:hypothetical protein
MTSPAKKIRSPVYKLKNVATHKAPAMLEALGVLDPWDGLNQIREMAAEMNLGIRSISSLNLEQRRALIEMGVLYRVCDRSKSPMSRMERFKLHRTMSVTLLQNAWFLKIRVPT